jgi:hypothetical protein
VKSPQDVFQERLNKAICAAPEEQGGRLVESGPVSRHYRCMERAATKAAAQFNAVNPRHAQPNILMFVNHDTTSHQGDFEEAVTGHFSGIRTCLALRDEIAEIDAYVWLNADKSEGRMLWSKTNLEIPLSIF